MPNHIARPRRMRPRTVSLSPVFPTTRHDDVDIDVDVDVDVDDLRLPCSPPSPLAVPVAVPAPAPLPLTGSPSCLSVSSTSPFAAEEQPTPCFTATVCLHGRARVRALGYHTFPLESTIV